MKSSRAAQREREGGGSGPVNRKERQRRYRSGLTAEFVAGVYLMARGYHLLERRCKTAAGEIDIVAVRGKRLAFVEVKRRKSIGEAEASITRHQRDRVRKAALVWIGARPRFQGHDIGFDLVFLVPGRLPVYLPDAL